MQSASSAPLAGRRRPPPSPLPQAGVGISIYSPALCGRGGGNKRTGEPYDRKARVSLRAELVRIGVRWFIKRRRRPTVAAARRSIRAAARWIPSPPPGTEVRAVDAGGVPGEFVATAASRRDRHVLFFHGGGYVTGSPALYRHFTLRIATAARAHVLAIDYRLAPEHPLPPALYYALAAHPWLLSRTGDPPRNPVLG